MIDTSHKIKITKFYKIPKDYYYDDAIIRYYGSLVPTLEILKHTNEINITVNLEPWNSQFNIPYNNNVNIHLFKPNYKFKNESCADLDCSVASYEILAHTLRALRVICHIYKLHNINIKLNTLKQEISDYISEWNINSTVIVGRIESLINYLLIEWLLDKGIPINTVQEMFVDLEIIRLKQNISVSLHQLYYNKMKKKYKIKLDDFFKEYNIEYLICSTPYIQAVNLTLYNTPVTLLQLTWGYSLTKALLDSIIETNELKFLFVIGGVGFVGCENFKIDDIFIPDMIVRGDSNNIQLEPIENVLLESKPYMKKINTKSISTGHLKTVIPSLNNFSNTEKLKGCMQLIDAFDMESEAFVDITKTSKIIKYGAIYYIMDLPNRGLGLGHTYYNYSFLYNLFSSTDRGKYHCFRRVFNYLQHEIQ